MIFPDSFIVPLPDGAFCIAKTHQSMIFNEILSRKHKKPKELLAEIIEKVEEFEFVVAVAVTVDRSLRKE